MLLEPGAEVDRARNCGFTALHKAADRGRVEVINVKLWKGGA